MTTQMHPHELRLAARTAKYDNTIHEHDVIADIDSFVGERVRDHEAHLHAATEKFLEDQLVHVDAGREIINAIDEEVRYKLLDGASPDELARRYEELRGLAKRATAALRRAAEASNFDEQRLKNPYGALCELWSKHPYLRPVYEYERDR